MTAPIARCVLIFECWLGRLIVFNVVLEKPGRVKRKALFILITFLSKGAKCTVLGGSICYEIHDGKIE